MKRTYKYRLYNNSKRNHHLHQQINVTGLIWNHALALQRHYYRLIGTHTSLGRKVCDLGFAQFMHMLGWVRASRLDAAFKCGRRVMKSSRWQPTIQRCSGCGQKRMLALQERQLCCDCGVGIGRDHNAVRNRLEAGHCLILPQLEAAYHRRAAYP